MLLQAADGGAESGSNMECRRLEWLPISVFLLVMGTFGLTYLVAVLNEHVTAGFPYISDTGTIEPESCIFGQFLNIAAVLLLACVYLRYRQLDIVLRAHRPLQRLLRRWLNPLAALCGAGSCLGLALVANFQETRQLATHMAGAFLCFFSATIFFCLQTYLTWRLLPDAAAPCAFWARAIVALLCVAFTVSTVAAGTLSIREFKQAGFKEVLRWGPNDPAYSLHLVSTVSEWLLVLCFCGFILTFASEFRRVTLRSPDMQVNGCEYQPAIAHLKRTQDTV